MNNKNIIGTLFIIVGIILMLNVFHITDINLMFDGWWTLLIIIPCLLQLISNPKNWVGPAIGVTIGIILLLHQQNLLPVINIPTKAILPAVIILTGIAIILKNKK